MIIETYAAAFIDLYHQIKKHPTPHNEAQLEKTQKPDSPLSQIVDSTVV